MNNPDALLPSESANRVESLAVTVFDAERIEAWNADIERFEDAPPELGEWKCSTEVDGRMIGPIREALR